MVITSLLEWWYSDGWLSELTRIRWSFLKVADKFSIGLLVKTLLAPFRQISVDEQARTAGGLINVLIDKLISRLVGLFMRLVMIILGIVTLLLLAVVSLIRMIVWPILPLLPVIGVALMLMVGAPWQII